MRRRGAPTVRKQASPGQRPGYRVRKGQSPERAAHFVTPFQGFVGEGRFSQGVALGWLVDGPLALRTVGVPSAGQALVHSRGGPVRKGRPLTPLVRPPNEKGAAQLAKGLPQLTRGAALLA